METAKLKKFAQKARRELIEQVGARLGQVMADDSLARREQPDAVRKLQDEIEARGEQDVIERAAYTWFNRFCALRFMDANHYNRVGVVSPAEGQTQPEILAEAKSGHVDETMVPESVRKRVLALLGGQESSRDPQSQAYRLLLVAVCNHWHQAMPFLFERIADYTELLMPDDLLSESAILGPMREAVTVKVCQDVEVIGWLYQFYISEKKEQVFAALKEGKKIAPENIPAATQLFTPHWIVRYLIENTLGRLWMLNRPNSRLIEQMDYYIKPEEPETDFLKISSPEEIRICDPACGSGHMLTYAFDLLYAIYEEEGYAPSEIPGKITTHNLYGIEIDERAGALAAFALTMKARRRQRRFFSKAIQPNICVLGNIRFEGEELKNYMDFIGRDLFTGPLQTTLCQFEMAENYGSLIRPEVTDVDGMSGMLELKDVSEQLFLGLTHQKVARSLRQAEYLSPKYHVVIANPPFMGNKGMNQKLGTWLRKWYPDSRSDLMTCFMERCQELTLQKGFWGMVNLHTWMFLKSYKSLRENLIANMTITSLLHIGRGLFGSDFGSVAFVIGNQTCNDVYRGVFRRLFKKNVDVTPVEEIRDRFLDESVGRYVIAQNQFKKIPGMPIAYWVPIKLIDIFDRTPKMEDCVEAKQGLSTSDNDRFLRYFWEVRLENTCFGARSDQEAKSSSARWFPHNKGGPYRKWAGNYDLVVDWQYGGKRIKDEVVRKYPYLNGNPNFVVHDDGYYFRESISWSEIGLEHPVVRFYPPGFVFNIKGMSAFPLAKNDTNAIMAFCNGNYVKEIAAALNPSMSFGIGNFKSLPGAYLHDKKTVNNVDWLVAVATKDWDSYETSWDFTGLPILNPDWRQSTLSEGDLKSIYQNLRAYWQETTLEMRRLEEENNRIFNEAYGLQDELKPEVSLNEITLTCNPCYRYGKDKSEDELEALLLADTMREIISYAVGCTFGRYSLDKPGLILANQGETIEDYVYQIREPSFEPDDDNVIPILDAAWFSDGIVERFREFLKVTFGTEHYEENLKFIESALGKNIRKYFLNDFYKDHVRRYKKRPIYWLFSSPKGSFNALIYMHRYRSDTVSVILNDYLREFRTKLEVRLANLEEVEASTDTSKRDKTAAVKEINQIRNTLEELSDWERKVILPLAEQKIEIDLDDGVKVNYPKFGDALKKIPGLG